jgi:hypothetical protein
VIAILLVLVALLGWKLKKKRQQEHAAAAELPRDPMHEKYQDMRHCYPAPPTELYAGNAAVEMGCNDPAELGIERKTPAQEDRSYGLDDPEVVLKR